MKFLRRQSVRNELVSHPIRGGWIEIRTVKAKQGDQKGPTPYGVGGLKFARLQLIWVLNRSHPIRGGWIEIIPVAGAGSVKMSHPIRGGWIEIHDLFPARQQQHSPTPYGVGGLKLHRFFLSKSKTSSHPIRGGWIEIDYRSNQQSQKQVPPHTGWVD